jgi:TatA/E family protein of Tat protein translocase
MPTPGPLELVIILVIALLVLGPGKLPDVGAALGKSIREFRKASTDIQESVSLDANTTPTPATPTTPTTPTAVPAPPTPAADPTVSTATPATPPPAAPAAETAGSSRSGTGATDEVAAASTTGPSSEPTPGTN